MLIKYTLAWFPMVAIAVLNGAARDKLYGPRMSPLAAHQISCMTGILLFTIYTVGLSHLFPLQSESQAILAGLVWLALTIVFEFSMICFIMKRPLSSAIAEYDIKSGRLWPLVLISVALLPWFAHWLTG